MNNIQMARFKILEKGNATVPCQILNESAGKYIVKFEDGNIERVSKSLVSDLDKIDEGVLDMVRNSGKAVMKYGKTVYNKAKDVAKKIADLIITPFRVFDCVFFKSDDGGILPVSHPLNAIEGALNCKSVNYIPSSSTVKLCDELGIEAKAVENFEFEGEYNGAVQFYDYLGESETSNNSLMLSLLEGDETVSSGKRLAQNEKIQLSGTFCDWSKEEIIDDIASEYASRYVGRDPQSLPLMIWGAPGIGKTQIIRACCDEIKDRFDLDARPEMLSINAANVGDDDFTYPGKIFEKIEKVDGETGVVTKITDLPKQWLPVYDVKSPNKEELRKLANGGHRDKKTGEIIDGPGGIFFIDEFSRLTQAAMNSLMQTPTTRNIGGNSNLTLGDRWVIVCAANRPSDMSRVGGSESLSFEAAAKTRFNHCNFVPDPEDWFSWATSESKKRKGRPNVMHEIVTYLRKEVKENPETFGDFYEVWNMPSGKLEGGRASACPRTWEALSEKLLDRYIDPALGKPKYSSLSQMPKAKLKKAAAGIIGGDVAERFATFAAEAVLFSDSDAVNVWTKGDTVMYEIIKQNKLNSANIEKYYDDYIFPLLKTNYPGGFEMGKVSPEAALNFMKFLEATCYDRGKFNLNRFKTVSAKFSDVFGVDTRSINGPYADAANYKETVVAKNEMV